MSNLYGNLSEVYEAMYQSFINYDEEFSFYNDLLQKYNCKNVLEIGCGTGNLADRFVKGNIEYTGLDMSGDMLSIAKKNHTGCNFIQGDMRNFNLAKKTDAAIITGRTISYLVLDEDVLAAFSSIHKNLNRPGIICFDCIDAAKFIPLIKPEEKIVHKAEFKNKKYHRESFWSVNDSHKGAFDWASFYYEEDDSGQLQKIGEDHSIIRAFYKEDITGFLQNTGFEIKEIIERPSYAFDTFVMVGEKVGGKKVNKV
jgi:SAM-dependent methyltransferase